MKTVTFERLLKQLSPLTPGPRSKLTEALKHHGHESEVAGRLRGHFESAPRCPHCAHERVYRHGHADRLQRYRCRACGKTFNAFPGTPLARLRCKAKWPGFLQQLLASQTVRQAARECAVHRNTSFRWRHRFLA